MPPNKVIGERDPQVSYVNRLAVRLVLRNDKSDAAIIHVKKGDNCKLPGGGIEADEDHALAGEREALEETGCRVSADPMCFATTEEFHNDLHQKSFCCSATVLEDLGSPELTPEEQAEGLEHQWVAPAAALDKLASCKPTSLLGNFIKERDHFFLKTFLSLDA